MKDPRFEHIINDPRFRKTGSKKNKVKIDSRFKHMFTDPEFSSVSFVDKRGRRDKVVSKENLEKFYELESESESNDEETNKKMLVVEKKLGELSKKGKKKKTELPPEDIDEEEFLHTQISDDEKKREDSEESDSSDGEDSEDDGDVQEEDDTWDEINACTQMTYDSSKRISICNLNWDRMNATDIFVMLHSFLEKKGDVLKVEIFPSQFGKEQMRKEKERGPEIKASDEGEEYNERALRKYQIERLKYYYAIITCDTSATSDILYKALDGVEYQLSSSVLDLRYVPHDMVFDEDPPTSSCTELPDMSTYTPPQFITTALQNSTVKLTWDETDQSRLALTTKTYSGKDLENVDFSAYIASSDEDEGDDADGDTKTGIERYRQLLAATEENDDNEIDQEMEITWTDGFEGNEKIVEEADKMAEKPEDDEGTFYEPDADDDFFATDKVTEKPKETKKKKKKIKKKDALDDKGGELALLMEEEGSETRKHFNMKKIIKSGASSTDDFRVDLTDDRFAALKSSHHYAIDPSAPEYRETPAAKELRSSQMEHLSRNGKRKSGDGAGPAAPKSPASLLTKIKNKQSAFTQKKESSKLYRTKTQSRRLTNPEVTEKDKVKTKKRKGNDTVEPKKKKKKSNNHG